MFKIFLEPYSVSQGLRKETWFLKNSYKIYILHNILQNNDIENC